MLDKILTSRFREELKQTFRDIQVQQDVRDQANFTEDEERIERSLLDLVEPYSSDVVLNEDFLIAAVDGSGTDSLSVLDDIRVHLVTTAAVVLDTNTRSESPLAPLDRSMLESALGHSQPHFVTHWYSRVRDDAHQKLAETLSALYPLKEVEEIVLPFFTDYTKGRIQSMQDLARSEYGRYIQSLQSMRSLISKSHILTNITIHDQLRTVAEYAAARELMTSNIHPKYLLLDGAMSVFLHPRRHYPAMPSGFMLRELCTLARRENIILCAVSKNHTIPFAHRIARLAEKKFGPSAKWFCHLPGPEDVGGSLRIYADTSYIPPILAVPYLFSFSRDNRPSRIDFDRVWWLQNVYVKDDPVATRQNEKALFRDLELMSRDARWYGYPVALALAHAECKLTYEDLRVAREVCRDVFHELGMDQIRNEPLREDYHLT